MIVVHTRCLVGQRLHPIVESKFDRGWETWVRKLAIHKEIWTWISRVTTVEQILRTVCESLIEFGHARRPKYICAAIAAVSTFTVQCATAATATATKTVCSIRSVRTSATCTATTISTSAGRRR